MPLLNTVHTDKLLSDISVKYSNTEYIADRVFPVVSVEKNSDLYRIYTRDFRIPETNRASKAVAREFSFEVTTASYTLQWNALKDYVPDNLAQNYDIFSLRADTVMNLTDAILRKREKMVADLFTITSFSLNVSLSTAQAFDATTTANPIPIFDTAATTIIGNTGQTPNFAILPRSTFVAIKNNTNVLDRVKYTSRDITQTIIGGLLDVPEILMPNAQYDSSLPGLTDVVASIWQQDNCFLGFKPANPGPLVPSVGYHFQKARPLVKRWRDEERESEAIEVNMEFVPKVVASLSGYFIRDTLA